jgi:hypothetical protein
MRGHHIPECIHYIQQKQTAHSDLQKAV